METIENGRTFRLTEYNETLPNLHAEMLRSGWDGKVYSGVSQPVGKQRIVLFGMFYRSAKTGEFKRVA